MKTAIEIAPPEIELSDVDRHFGRLIARLSAYDDAGIAIAASLASRATGEGDVCVDLAEFAGRPLPAFETEAPRLDTWLRSLRQSPAVGRPGDFKPLILDDQGRLYLYRYWEYEKRLAENLLSRAVDVEEVDEALLRDGLRRLFPESRDAEQKRAAAMAVLRRFCVISGGPGTGKTFTVVKILALLAEQGRGRRPAIALAAPTGKAAARVQEAIRRALERVDLDDPLRACIPGEAFTIHRLLGARPDSVYFRHHRENPLPLDVVIIDEASMADLALMTKLVEALPRRARLILLGDKDQLASVEAGAVLADICAGSGSGLTAAFATRLARVTGAVSGVPEIDGAPRSPLRDSIALLSRSYRFGSDSGIGALAARINQGDGEGALDLLQAGKHHDIAWHGLDKIETTSSLAASAVSRLTAYLEAVRGGAPAGEIFALFNTFRVLCAHRSGPAGATAMNAAIERALEERRLVDARRSWYAGRPVMITRNDYNLQLFNGDVGITLPDDGALGGLRVFFPASEGRVRAFSPARLPEHETVYAMTVHKSQGSEFEEIMLVLPTERSRVMGRELIYTGITRARNRVEVWGNGPLLVEGVCRQARRKSALKDRLWRTPDMPLA